MALLECGNLRKSYGGNHALDGVALRLEQGEVLGVVGPNGAGKTTLLDVLTGITRQDRGKLWQRRQNPGGTISFQARSIANAPAYKRARLGLGRTFQTPQLNVSRSCLDNVLLGATARQRLWQVLGAPTKSDRATALAVMERCGVQDIADTKPDKVPQARLRLVEIARALAAGCQLLCLDEPTVGMTLAEANQLAELLRHLNADGVTILVVSHDIPFLTSIASRVVVLNFGRVLKTISPDEVTSDPEIRRIYLGMSEAA